MFPQQYLKKIASAVSKRSGICQATVEQVLPAFIDEVRFQLTEGKLSVPIDSFGTFALIDIPERQHLYTYKGANELRTLPPKKKLKFAPARSFRRELEAGVFDVSRKAFCRHPKDPILRNRAQMAYRADRKDQINKGATKFLKPTTDDTDDTIATPHSQGENDDISDISHQPSSIV